MFVACGIYLILRRLHMRQVKRCELRRQSSCLGASDYFHCYYCKLKLNGKISRCLPFGCEGSQRAFLLP